MPSLLTLDLARAPATHVKPISVVLIGDNRETREGMVALIRRQPGFTVLATGAIVEEAIRLVRQQRPDVVLLDVGGDEEDRLTLAGALHGQVPDSRVILMGVRPACDHVQGFIVGGVAGFIMADATLEQLLGTIQSVAQGVQVLPRELTGSLFAQLGSEGIKPSRTKALDTKELTPREGEVADLIIQGFCNKEIAQRIGISLHTVKSHVHKVLSKLAVNTRLEVAAFAQRGVRRDRPDWR